MDVADDSLCSEVAEELPLVACSSQADDFVLIEVG